MLRKEKLTVGIACLLALTTLSCKAQKEAQEKANVMKTAVAFYKAIEETTPEMERVMGLKDYKMYRYPALVYGSTGISWWGVQKLEGAAEVYEVEIPFWCHGNDSTGAVVKLRRQLLVRVAADAASDRGWAVTGFKFQGDQELTIVRQFFTWLLWMFISPLAFLLVLFIFLMGWLWPKIAVMVAYLMGMPLRTYVSYLCFGTVWGAVVAMVAWAIFESWLISTRKKSG